MANLEAQPNWSSVRLLEAHELARGGLNGNMNEQAKALAERTEFLNQEKASKQEIIQGVFEFGTYAEFNAAKATLPANCTVVIGEENTTGSGQWGIGNNRWNGTVLKKSEYNPTEIAKNDTTQKIVAFYNNELTSSFILRSRLDTTGSTISDTNYLCTDFLRVSMGDTIKMKTTTGPTRPPVICFYDENKNYINSQTNTAGSVLEEKTVVIKNTGFIRCATRIAEITERSLIITPAHQTSLTDDANVLEIKDDLGNKIAYIDAAGELYIPNLGGKSIQDTIQTLQDIVSKIKGSAQSALSIVTDTAPAIRKITDTQNAILEFTDETFGDLYLPGMNNQSVQEHFSLLSERINNMHKTNAIFDAYNDFGIKPNGMSPTETYYKIQIAVNFISKLPDGGTLVFRPGAYLTSAAIRPESKVIFKFMRGARLIPVGRSAAFTREPTGSDVALNYLNDAAFIDIEIDGSEQSLGNGSYSSSIKGYYIGGFNRCFWLRNYVHDTAATGIGVDFAKDSFILDSIAQGCGRLAEVGTPGASGIGIGTGILQDESLIISGNICKNNLCTRQIS